MLSGDTGIILEGKTQVKVIYVFMSKRGNFSLRLFKPLAAYVDMSSMKTKPWWVKPTALDRRREAGWRVYATYGPFLGHCDVRSDWSLSWLYRVRDWACVALVHTQYDEVGEHQAVWPFDLRVANLDLEEEAMSFLKKATAAVAKKEVRGNAEAAAWAEQHAALWEYMTAEAFEDGEARETSMLMVFCEDMRFKACLQDRAAGQSLWATGSTLEAALAAIEAHLRAGTGDWRRSKQGPSKGKSRK